MIAFAVGFYDHRHLSWLTPNHHLNPAAKTLQAAQEPNPARPRPDCGEVIGGLVPPNGKMIMVGGEVGDQLAGSRVETIP